MILLVPCNHHHLSTPTWRACLSHLLRLCVRRIFLVAQVPIYNGFTIFSRREWFASSTRYIRNVDWRIRSKKWGHVRPHAIDSMNGNRNHPLKLFFSVLNLSIISLGEVSVAVFVATLYVTGPKHQRRERVDFRGPKQPTEYVPHWVARQAPEHVPLLLVTDRGASDRDGVRVDDRCEARETRIPRVDGAREPEVARSVFVPDVRDRVVGQRCAEQLERGVHLGSGALEEHTAAADEERVSREDRACNRRRRGVGHVVADRVARVARRRKTPDSRESSIDRGREREGEN